MIESTPLFQEHTKTKIKQFRLSDTLIRALQVIKQICDRPVYDHGQLIPNGLVATEFLMAGIVFEGTGAAAEIINRVSQGGVNSFNILEAINVDPTTLYVAVDPVVQSFTLGSVENHPAIAEFNTLPDPSSLPVPPTLTSNWLVPDKFLIGEKPGNYNNIEDDFNGFIDAGITTVVCLIGEYKTLDRYKSSYPSKVEQLINNREVSMRFVFFPVPDFQIAKEEHILRLVQFLKRELLHGETIYMHCLGGHGRTGLICITLIASLYGISPDRAKEYCQVSHDCSERGRKWGGHLPETDRQFDMIVKCVESLSVIKRKR
eukprot:TRINITY_DN1777_c0_g1_i1.p1 TRINITY_DN1777_c0_g1~~TRINITY_DN1777_c0_g1_i1.p1  ORF type:complete len:317 (-),score=64.03 TRINITY_DN1777_c0_g1_i1:57-1007(-)